MEDNLLAAIIGAIAGVVTTYLGAILKFRVDLKSQYDKDLRDRRIAQYAELWKLTGTFPKYAREKQPTYQDIQGLMVLCVSGISPKVACFSVTPVGMHTLRYRRNSS